MPPVITAEKVSKKYIISHQQAEAYSTLRDTLANGTKQLTDRLLGRAHAQPPTREDFWALQDVSFEINKGDRVGIIGRNGSGKSTLLKILSQITEPTTGHIELRGRVAALLEVGTGFHPELTGRENILLNGAILGMSRVEIRKKFDEIVAFAGVEKFLDTPVKRYSSGMYVRLAFAVAAHLEPEILIVDEVLAVGDAQFQKKCLGKMKEVGSEGRTVLFVSHNMAAIQELCDTCIWLDKGQKILAGPTSTVIEKYISNDSGESEGYIDLKPLAKHKQLMENSAFKYTGIKIINSEGEIKPTISLAEPFSLEIEGEILRETGDFILSYALMSSLGYVLVNGKKNSSEIKLPKIGKVCIRLDFPQNYFAPGGYSIGLGANSVDIVDWIADGGSFHIESVAKGSVDISPDDFAGVMVYPTVWSARKA